MKFLFLSVLFLRLFTIAHSQGEPDQQPSGDASMQRVELNRIYGKVLDKSGKPLEAVSVQLFWKTLTGEDSLMHGMLTRSNGDFAFEDLPSYTSYSILVSAIGYEPVTKPLQAKPGSNGRFRIDLGNLSLDHSVQQLGGVTVTANRPALEMGIDRKIFNASRSLVSAGGTAADLMKNIPSVTVDVDGNVKLRSSTSQVFVDGRPTILTLDQIPADNIERVELITNPSARFDAASSGGIINIVLKKNKRAGLNGVASVGTGSPSIFNASLNVNLRQGKFNFFISTGLNQSGGHARSETRRINRSAGVAQDYFNQSSITERRRINRTLRFGTDFFIDNRNTISFTQQVSGGHFNYTEDQDQQYLDQQQALQYYGTRLSMGKTIFRRNASILNYKHSFPRAGKELTADINYNYGTRDDASTIDNLLFNPDGSAYAIPSLVRNQGGNQTDQVTLQADFVNPLTDSSKIEAGLRSYHNRFTSLYDVFAVTGATQEKLPLSNHYRYDEMVNAAYFTYSNKLKWVSYQAGLRAEYSKFSGNLIDSSFKFGYEYPSAIGKVWNALFPSLFLTRSLSEKTDIQLNYSRRINRPNFWQINPTIDISDPANLRQGNIALQPEFINSFEFNYNHTYASGSFLGVLYFRNNPADITEYSDTITAAQYNQLQNAAISPNAILNTFINANTTNRYGAEFTLQQKLGSSLTLTPTVNLQYRTVKARVGEQDLSNQGFNWEGKLIAEYKLLSKTTKLLNNLSFQLVSEYESSEVIPQGRSQAQYSTDVAMRKDFLKNNKATMTFSINDVFNTNRWGTIYDTDNFYQNSYRRWNVRSFRLTFSYKFGNADFAFGNKTRRPEND